jgi:hypothetical protein
VTVLALASGYMSIKQPSDVYADLPTNPANEQLEGNA